MKNEREESEINKYFFFLEFLSRKIIDQIIVIAELHFNENLKIFLEKLYGKSVIVE